MMGLCALPLLGSGLDTRRRSAEDSVRSGIDGARLRLGSISASFDMGSPKEGEVGLISSKPLVLEGVVAEVAVGGLDVMGIVVLLGRDVLTRMVSSSFPSPCMIYEISVTDTLRLVLSCSASMSTELA
jgi:hypothetical protein